MKMPLHLGTAVTLSIAISSIVSAQEVFNPEGLKTVQVIRIDTPPVIDGKLDEAVWQQAEVVTDFHQIRPGDGTEPFQLTELYLLYDDDAFYIGARMYDSEPGSIAAPTIRHGQGLGSDDRLVVIIDPFNTRRGGYRFETNLNAVRHDALYQNVTSFISDWSVIWDVAATVEEDAWVAELEIPFKSLPFDPEIETWGFNFGRGIRRLGEEVAWVSRNRTYNPSIVGLATGLSGMDQGLGLDIVPSMSINQRRQFDPSGKDSNFDPSLDVFYRLTPALNAALTINTDFSATEVDNRQVNLTRFNLFFPEKRDFFLNDADLFQFGNIGGGGFNSNRATSRGSRENARPYFSRKLGLSQNGQPVDIEYGGRVSGRIGRWNIGTLAIQQDEFNGVDASTLFVGRVSANVLSESILGMIVTNGDPASNIDNSVFGIDFRYLNTRLGNGRVMEGDAWYQQSDTPGLEDDDAAFGVGLRSPNNTGLRGGFALKEVEKNFNPAMGFVNRSNIRNLILDVGYTHFFESSLLQEAFFGFDAQRINSLDGDLQSEALVVRLLEIETTTNDQLELRYIRNKEVVSTQFSIYSDHSGEIFIQPGQYEFNEKKISIDSGNQRKISGDLSYQTGDFYNGKRTNIDASFTWAQSRNFRMSMSYDWNDIELPQGDFITRLASISTEVVFSSTLYWITLVQYDNVSEELGINTRIQWIPTAGQEGLIVLNHNLQDFDKDNRFQSALSDLSIKFKYTLRY